MTRPYVVTGAASGIGAATRALLIERGHAVLGVDLTGSDIDADLSNEAGRQAMIAAVAAHARNGIAGIAAVAGSAQLADPALIVSVNHFGAVATLDRLRPLLRGGERPRAVLVASSAVLLPHDQPIIGACLAGDEARARAAAIAEPSNAYASSKRAIALWMRREATGADWAGSGIALNGVAPGTVKTPMTLPLLETEEGRAILKGVTPIAVPEFGEPRDLAEVIVFLLTMDTGYMLGQLLFVDGGTDALMRAGGV